MEHLHLTPIPLPPLADATPGALFRSAMPFRHDDGALLDEAAAAGVRAIVWLVPLEEGRSRADRDLGAEYAARGFVGLHLPIEDFGTPTDLAAFEARIEDVAARLRAGEGILVHCLAGVGRTGMFLACLIGRLSGLASPACVDWVRARIPNAVETEAQRAFVEEFSRGR